MRYTDFRDSIRDELACHDGGLTWVELKTCLHLPYERPCPTWVKELEREIGLSRVKGSGRAHVWRLDAQLVVRPA